MNVDKLNNIITTKAALAVNSLQQEQSKLGMKHDANDSLEIIKLKFSKTAGFINRIRFNFKKSGVYVHKGVGRGTKISQVGTTKRKKKEWFNPVIEKYADEIMEEVADEWVDIIFDKLKIK